MTIVRAACVIPVQSKDVHVAIFRFCQRYASIGRVQSVIEVKSLALMDRAWDAFYGLFEHAWNGYGCRHIALLELNWFAFCTQERAHQRAEGSHRAATLPAGDCNQSLLLVRIGTVICNDTDRPVARTHRPGCVGDYGKVQPIQVNLAISPLVDVKRHSDGATAFGGLACEVCSYARA